MKKFIINNLKDFELDHIFECGQCFRWKKQDDGSYTGVIKEGVINIKKEKDIAIVCGEVVGNLEEIFYNYFDMATDYEKIKRILCKNDNNMKLASEYGYGIRILKQDLWEMIISFIISAANNIPRISKTIENISKEYGEKVEFEGVNFYLFPSPLQLSKASKDDLRKLNLGFRDKYVYEVTQKVVNGEFDLEHLLNMPLNEAKKELMKLPGVGAKVADCILLFSMGRKEAFPIDTWIKKVMNELYIESTNITKINEYAINKFGAYAGIAQQYLFYYKREN